MHGAGAKIVKRDHASSHGANLTRQRDIGRIRDVSFAVDGVGVNFSLKSLLHVMRLAAELNGSTAVCLPVHLKSVRLEPRGHCVDILLRGPELLAELLRSEPLMIAGRSGVLLI